MLPNPPLTTFTQHPARKIGILMTSSLLAATFLTTPSPRPLRNKEDRGEKQARFDTRLDKCAISRHATYRVQKDTTACRLTNKRAGRLAAMQIDTGRHTDNGRQKDRYRGRQTHKYRQRR